jgi:hypothetical protein
MTNHDPLDALAKPPPPPSELDELMSRDPLDLSEQDVDKIIAVQRQARAAREAPAGGRRRKSDLVEHDNAKPIDLAALGLLKPKAAPTAPTSSGSGFRRM